MQTEETIRKKKLHATGLYRVERYRGSELIRIEYWLEKSDSEWQNLGVEVIKDCNGEIQVNWSAFGDKSTQFALQYSIALQDASYAGNVWSEQPLS